jgi:L-alanine-DL-glutamate epimerase-like enolase superfamily enzyme
MLQLRLHPFHLKLRHAFNIARDSYSTRDVVIVELTDGVHSGFGEAITNAYYKVNLQEIENVFNALQSKIEAYQFQTPELFWSFFKEDLKNHPFMQCALDNAAHDFFGKKIGKPSYEIWGLNPSNCPLTNYTIAIDSIKVMLAKMQEMPWPIYKIKLGTANDIEIITTLRKHTDAVFRVDANCGWSADETIHNALILKDLGVEFIEQPLKPEDWKGMEKVFQHSALPIIADESCQKENDVQRCNGYFHGINIKLVKCGGLTPAFRMIQEAKASKMKVMMGCMTETSIGISAIANISPLLDYVDMDGALLLANDPAKGVRFDYGKVIFPNENGLGCSL